MNIRHLRVFLTVVDSNSMTRAAERLFISQPSVSQTIMELENHYNVKLFERLSKKLYITKEGEQLLGYARHIVSLFDKMEESMNQSIKNSTIRIGASITIGTCILSELTSQFINKNPGIKIESVVDNTTIIEDMVLKNRLDFGLVEGPTHNLDIVRKPFMDDELIVICGNNHPLRKRKYFTIEELSKADLILREKGSGTRELFESVMASRGYNLKVKWTCNNAETIKNTVSSNIGISVISKIAVEEELKKGKLAQIKVDGLELKRKFNIIYHKNKYISEPIEDFWKLCFT